MSTRHEQRRDERPARTPGMSAKDEILARARAALAVPRRNAITEAADVPRAYQRADDRQETSTDPAKVRDILVRRLEEYTAVVHRTDAGAAPSAIVEALGTARRVVVPPELPAAWTSAIGDAAEGDGSAAEDRLITDDGTMGPRELDAVDAVLTGCHVAIAATGTIVLRADGMGGRRALTLVPDLHVVVVDASQVVLGVPRAIEVMAEDPTAAWTMISGPSATSDIELERVEGVHGPRHLHVVLIEPTPSAEEQPEETA